MRRFRLDFEIKLDEKNKEKDIEIKEVNEEEKADNRYTEEERLSY